MGPEPHQRQTDDAPEKPAPVPVSECRQVEVRFSFYTHPHIGEIYGNRDEDDHYRIGCVTGRWLDGERWQERNAGPFTSGWLCAVESPPYAHGMTSHEKAVAALNRRLERLQATLRVAEGESAQSFLVQAVIVTLGLGEVLNAYIAAVGSFTRRCHERVKQSNNVLGEQHADLLRSGKELLERLKSNPTDQALRKEIERVQHAMAGIQKSLRRGTNALQRDIAPSVAMIDRLSESVRRIYEADDSDSLKRSVKTIIGQVHELCAAQRALPVKAAIDVSSWERSAVSEIDQASDRYDVYARACYQALLGVSLMTIAVSEDPLPTAEEAMKRANESVAARLKDITARFTPL